MPKKKTDTGPPHDRGTLDSGLGSPQQVSQNLQHNTTEKIPEDPAFASTGAQEKTSQASSPIGSAFAATKKKKIITSCASSRK